MKPKFNGKIIFVFFLFFTVLLEGCVVEESSYKNDFSRDQSLIQLAEEWYNVNQSSNITSRSYNLIDGSPKWKESVVLQHKGKEVLEIPVKLKIKDFYSQRNGKNFDNRSGDYRLLLFKIGDEFRPYLMKVELKSNYFPKEWKDLSNLNLVTIPSDFSGQYIFTSLIGKFTGSWQIEKGKRIRSNSFKRLINKNEGNPPNLRSLTWEYHCEVTTYTTYVKSGDGEPQVVEQYEVWDCEFTYIPEQVAPPSSNDPDSGGENPGCYEPHPDIEGFMVPCGSLEPNCPCCHLPENQRAACEEDQPPCKDLPMKTMELASPGTSGKNGARYGMTRNNGTKFHNGLDIAAEPGTYVYSPFSGKVSNIVSSFSPGEYKEASFGNYVTVESIDSNGDKFFLRYSHLNYTLVKFGDEIEAGQVIGISGNTGNAKNVTNKHVHVLGSKKNSNGQIVGANPEDYLKTKWDSSGNISEDPCNY